MANRSGRRRRAVALHYEPKTYTAPQVVARGAGDVADRIISLAREHNVPIHEDGDLVALLAQLDIGAVIPPELYAAVAEVLAFVYRLKQAAESQGLRETE
ncbi:MAG: EscU/YscU/HrcU family type III secretion system export apparatus switch protein [Anaerolineae bacterium]